jgi:hypothetical protein
METAAKILVVGGVLSLAMSFVLGYVLSNSRLKQPKKDQYYLLLSHKNALWEGFMMLGLVFAVQLAVMKESTKVIAALLIVAAAIFQVGGSMVAWLMGTKDEFAERSPSFYVVTINAIMVTIGLAILIFGVLRTVIQQGF